MYATAATIRQGAKSGKYAKVPKKEQSLNWAGAFDMLAIGPSPSDTTPERLSETTKFLYLDFPNNVTGPNPHC